MKKNNVDLMYNISELANIFHETQSIPRMLNKTVDIVSSHMHSDVCSIYLYDENSKELVLKATHGLKPESIDKVRMPLGEGICGTALKELRSISLEQASEHPNFKHFPQTGEMQYSAFLAVPILKNMERLGVLTLQHANPGYFTEDDKKALKTIATQLAIFLDHAKLFQKVQNSPAMEIQTSQKEQIPNRSIIRGISTSEGIAIGTSILLSTAEEELYSENLEDKYRNTLKAFHKAVDESKKQVQMLLDQLEENYLDMAHMIFSAHLLMLNDSAFTGRMAQHIKDGNSPYQAVVRVMNHYTNYFIHSENPRLKEKVQDIKDLGHRILRNLLIKSDSRGDYRGQIVISRELLPSELLKIATQDAEGIILFGTGASAHISILAKSLHIPVIFTDNTSLFALESDTPLVLDGKQGNIHINPEPNVQRQFKRSKAAQKNAQISAHTVPEETRLKDNTRIILQANINLLSDLKTACMYKAEGIGLYRSEFPFIIRNDYPSEDEQYHVYRRLFEEFPDKEITLRTLDIGGDKILSYMPIPTQNNPFLGLRALRFTLENKDIFKTQLRAMLRAGAEKKIKIMFPLVSSIDEFLEAKKLVKTCIKELKKSNEKFHSYPEIGAMVELPSLIEILAELSAHCDFLCIGTNDLIQYMLGVDRTNEFISDHYITHHPSVLRTLSRIAGIAEDSGCELSICGEITTQRIMLCFLIGIGIRKFSMEPQELPEIKKCIIKTSLEDCKNMAAQLLSLSTIDQVNEFLSACPDKI